MQLISKKKKSESGKVTIAIFKKKSKFNKNIGIKIV